MSRGLDYDRHVRTTSVAAGRFPLKFRMAALLVAAVVLVPGVAAFSTDLDISGFVEYDVAFAIAENFNAAPTGKISKTIGGAVTDTTFSGSTVVGANPQAGTLTDLLDGFGLEASAVGGFVSPEAEFGAAIDLSMTLTNTSATDTYLVTVKLTYDNKADASGPDAFVESEFTLDDPGGEIFDSHLESDTVFGDKIGGSPLGTFGDPLADAGMFIIPIELTPGASSFLTGELVLEGGAFDPGSTFDGSFVGSLQVIDVLNKTTPIIPAPGAIGLVAMGLAGLPAVRWRKYRTKA